MHIFYKYFVYVVITCFLLYFLTATQETWLGNFPGKTCACKQCMNNDSWFMQHYASRVPKLLNRRNSNLSKSTLDWWLMIQPYHRKKFHDIVQPLFSLFPDKEHYSDAGPKRCRICAVVGNSDNLIGSNYGELIDAHDFIFRINQGPTVGYEKDVGCRTTHRALYPESAIDLDNSTHLVMLPFKVLDLEWLISIFTDKSITRTYTNVKPTIKADKNKVMIMSPEFIRYVYERWLKKQGKYPSSGFLILVLALHICDQVNVFGYGPRKDGTWHHYYEKNYQFRMSASVHKGSFEYAFIQELAQRNKIKMYKGRREELFM